MVIRKMQNWTLRLFGLWHLKHERNGGVADCFRTESGELCNQVWDAGSDTASCLGPSCGWGSSITARWRKDRLDGMSVAQETSRKNGCTPGNSVCSSHAWTPRHTKAKLLSGELYLQLLFLLTHKRYNPISIKLWHVVCLPFCLSGYCSGPPWVSEGTWIKEASHSSCRNSQLWLKPE